MTWPTFTFDPRLDLFPLLAATLAALGCGLLGNFLVLRRLSLMGDAISHSVLPGLVIAFIVSASRNPLPMFLGAAIAGVVTVVLVELVKKLGRVEPGAAMGVVFSALFALGVLLIERAAVRHTDLDADCVLHGQLETLTWNTGPSTIAGMLDWATIDALPRQVVVLLLMVVLAVGFIALLFKELRLAAFDPELATSQGYSATLLHYLLMIFVAAATVASFEAVGSILVIAMLVCPAATARLLTDRLLPQIIVSAAIALTCGIGGYIAATAIPSMFEKDAVNAAGSITIIAGLLLVLAIVLAPRHGLVPRLVAAKRLASRIAVDDLLASLYRSSEAGRSTVPLASLRAVHRHRLDTALASASRAGLVLRQGDLIELSAPGSLRAADIIRRHRLWERYLVDEVGTAPDHVHDQAERLEHLPTAPPATKATDPHGRPIPPTPDE